MVRYGMSPMAHPVATVVAAQLLDQRHDLGSIEPGRSPTCAVAAIRSRTSAS